MTRFNAVRNMYFESVYNFYSGFGTILEEPSSGSAIVKKKIGKPNLKVLWEDLIRMANKSAMLSKYS